MPIERMSNWGTWQQTRNTLTLAIAMNTKARNLAALETVEEKAHHNNLLASFDAFRLHALNGLHMVNLDAANPELIASIKTASKNAKAEADRIRNDTATIENLSGLVNGLTSLVNLFNSL